MPDVDIRAPVRCNTQSRKQTNKLGYVEGRVPIMDTKRGTGDVSRYVTGGLCETVWGRPGDEVYVEVGPHGGKS